jgi:hypothetical protein
MNTGIKSISEKLGPYSKLRPKQKNKKENQATSHLDHVEGGAQH